jgi:hypothetical protein
MSWLENTRNALDNDYRLEVVRVADELIELIDMEPEENPEQLVNEYIFDHPRVMDIDRAKECLIASPNGLKNEFWRDKARSAFRADVDETIKRRRNGLQA